MKSNCHGMIYKVSKARMKTNCCDTVYKTSKERLKYKWQSMVYILSKEEMELHCHDTSYKVYKDSEIQLPWMTRCPKTRWNPTVMVCTVFKDRMVYVLFKECEIQLPWYDDGIQLSQHYLQGVLKTEWNSTNMV